MPEGGAEGLTTCRPERGGNSAPSHAPHATANKISSARCDHLTTLRLDYHVQFRKRASVPSAHGTKTGVERPA